MSGERYELTQQIVTIDASELKLWTRLVLAIAVLLGRRSMVLTGPDGNEVVANMHVRKDRR